MLCTYILAGVHTKKPTTLKGYRGNWLPMTQRFWVTVVREGKSILTFPGSDFYKLGIL